MSRTFRHPGRSLAAAGLLLLLSGCGQTGPLTLPPPETPPAQAPAQPSPAPEAAP